MNEAPSPEQFLQPTSVILCQNPETVIASLPSIETLSQPKAIILSTTTLRNHYLTGSLKNAFLRTTFFERDLTRADQPSNEGDIIISPRRCILLVTLAEITQTLPSNTSNRIQAVAERYHQIEILVMNPGRIRGKDVAEFIGWAESFRREHSQLRIGFAEGKEEVKWWVKWLCIRRESDDVVDSVDFLHEDESEVTTNNLYTSRNS